MKPWSSVEEGAEAILNLALSPALEERSGGPEARGAGLSRRFLVGDRPRPPGNNARTWGIRGLTARRRGFTLRPPWPPSPIP